VGLGIGKYLGAGAGKTPLGLAGGARRFSQQGVETRPADLPPKSLALSVRTLRWFMRSKCYDIASSFISSKVNWKIRLISKASRVNKRA